MFTCTLCLSCDEGKNASKSYTWTEYEYTVELIGLDIMIP